MAVCPPSWKHGWFFRGAGVNRHSARAFRPPRLTVILGVLRGSIRTTTNATVCRFLGHKSRALRASLTFRGWPRWRDWALLDGTRESRIYGSRDDPKQDEQCLLPKVITPSGIGTFEVSPRPRERGGERDSSWASPALRQARRRCVIWEPLLTRRPQMDPVVRRHLSLISGTYA